MKVKIKRFDTSLPLPMYKTQGAACVDMVARVDISIAAKSVGYIPLNVALELPEGSFSLLVPRSSTHKMGLLQANSVGILDHDYSGNNDEYIFAAYNYTDADVVIEKGTRVAQLIVLQYQPIEFEEVAHLGSMNRGGFGSTGRK